MAGNVHGGPRRGRQAGARWPRTIRLLSALALAVGSAGLLAAPAAQASAAHPRPPSALSRPGPGLWQPGPLRGAGSLPPAASPVRAPGGTWTVQPTPNPLRQPNGLLLADSCTSATACTAVGQHFNRAGITVTLAERWNGTKWRIQATPDPAGATFGKLTGVSCTSVAACTAVGYYFNSLGDVRTLAERWNGTDWRIQRTPNPARAKDAGFFGVSCTSAAACTAAGESNVVLGPSLTLAEVWNGKDWRIQATPNPAGAQDSGLFGVSCTTAGACTAAGAYENSSGTTVTLAEAWNGKDWRVHATPNPAGAAGTGFTGVSCSAPAACTAVGSSDTSSGAALSLAERWNGKSWRIQAIPTPPGAPTSSGATSNELYAVSCPAARACTAVGGYTASTGTGVTLAEVWNGKSWRIQATPSPAGDTGSGFSAVSCVSARSCAAAGSYAHGLSAVDVTLAGAWNGTRWRVVATPNQLGAAFSGLEGVSCPSPRSCVAGGSFMKSPNVTLTLAEVWNGKSWRLQATPNPAGAVSAQFSGVSCGSPRSCAAVGSNLIKHRETLLAERWNGKRWVVQAVPAPPGATSGSFSGVSCSGPGACTAVGLYGAHGGAMLQLAERWNGKRWSVEPTPTPGGSTNSRFSGVSCSSPRACTAVGYYTASTGQTRALAEAWNGTSWHIQPVPGPASAVTWILYGVSCSSPGACTGVGLYFSSVGPLTLAERWNGKDWRPQATPNEPNAERNQLNGVSCASAGSCTAVGDYEINDFTPPVAFAEAWNGTRWVVQAAPGPAGTVSSTLNGVSCTSAGCAGTGHGVGQSGVTVTLAEATGAQ